MNVQGFIIKSKKSAGSFRNGNGSAVLPKTIINLAITKTTILITMIFSKVLNLLNLYLIS
jgi:hypothetical protein